jgi:hypothetical protein
MEKTTNKIIHAHEQLLQARQQNLENQVVGTLRSHGKLWGMDVFSWYKPSLYELENTLSSFPAPICWFANENDVLNLLTEKTDWLSNVKLVCTYDKAGFKLPNQIMDYVETILGAAKIDDALNLLRATKKAQGILLFTSSGENWNLSKNTFEEFLSLHQNHK